MAITSLDGIIAGTRPPEGFRKEGAAMQGAGRLHSLFYAAGIPGAAAVPSPGLAGAALTTYAGQLPWTNPSSGRSYVSRFFAASTGLGACLLLDRLWHNSGIVVTTVTAQTLNSVAWPARDRDGTTAGEGVMIALEVSTVLDHVADVTTCTMSYTNQSGTAGRTGTLAVIPALAAAGTFLPFSLQTGDTGVRSVQTITLGTSLIAGAVHLVAYRTLVGVPHPVANLGAGVNPVSGGFTRCYDSTVPFLVWAANSTAAVTVTGQMTIAQG